MVKCMHARQVCVCVCGALFFICIVLFQNGSHQVVATQPLVSPCQGFGHINEVAQIMSKLLKPLVFCFKAYAP